MRDALPATPEGDRKWKEIAAVLKKDRSSNTISRLSEGFQLTRDYIEAIAEHLVKNKLIFESAPPKGHTVAKPSINDEQIKQIFRILEVNGQGPDVRAKISQQYGIPESVVIGFGKILTESNPTKPVTESAAPATAEQARQSYLAGKLRDEVVVAESKTPDQWSIQDIQSQLAGFYPGR